MIDVITEVEVIPPAVERSFGARQTAIRNRTHAAASYAYGVGGQLDIVASITSFVLEVYHRTAHQKIEQYLGPDPTKYQLVVDGVPNAPIESASLVGEGIVATPLGNIDDLKKAFDAAMRHLNSAAPFRTGYYKTSARTSSLFTVLVNGKEVSTVNWDDVTTRSNIQIYSKARYASPLESIHRGSILLGARNAADKTGASVRASFTYRSPDKFGQVAEFSKRTGQKFTPLAVPVLEIGLVGSNVTDYIGNIEYNLERNRKRSGKNLVDRNILPESRRIERRLRRTPKAPRGAK